MLLLSTTSLAKKEAEIYWWVCSQPGYVEKVKVYAVTHVFSDTPTDYDAKEEVFEEFIEEQAEGFETMIDPSCRDFSTDTKSKKYLKKMVSKAKKRGFNIFWIDFSGLEE